METSSATQVAASINTALSAEQEQQIVARILSKVFWQGSVLARSDLLKHCPDLPAGEWWVIASQTCNLYNPSLTKVPQVELISASEIDELHPAYVKGNEPRTLHAVAESEGVHLKLQVNILLRYWIARTVLADLPAPIAMFVDNSHVEEKAVGEPNWNERFTGWLGRSYTRIALPDDFNDALKAARLTDLLDKKLAQQEKQIYGVYLSVRSDSKPPWTGIPGLMPPPYNLEILVAVEEDVLPTDIQKIWIDVLTKKTLKDPDNDQETVSREELARRKGIRISSRSIRVKSISEIPLSELKGYVRYSMLDYLSNSAMAAPDEFG